MNKNEYNMFLQPKRHILALAAGIIGGTLPNTNSNANPFIVGAILAAFTVKMIYGDYDTGYQWTFSDIVFWVITILEGIIGAYIIVWLQ
jgi:hypothetical protein